MRQWWDSLIFKMGMPIPENNIERNSYCKGKVVWGLCDLYIGKFVWGKTVLLLKCPPVTLVAGWHAFIFIGDLSCSRVIFSPYVSETRQFLTEPWAYISFTFSCRHLWADYIDGLGQVSRNSIANALELRLSCTNPSTCTWSVGTVCKTVVTRSLVIVQRLVFSKRI